MKNYYWLLLLCLSVFLSGCMNPTPDEVVVQATGRSATRLPTWTPKPRRTPDPTTTSTPAPTPTAPTLEIVGNPRGLLLRDPVPQNNALCGLVDILDFPLNPPDGIGMRGGSDFGVYRDRYGKYHAGEDWSIGRGTGLGPGSGFGGASSFGEPVFSIGHGIVTYAEPEGWGADKGVVIVRHTLIDGSSFLSFYGHLDPPSVTLQVGQCLRRGDPVGKIGRPRTYPHLHFEVRKHLPVAPGPGYWSSDPTGAGWLAPSQTILENRMESSVGYLWDAESDSSGAVPLGRVDSGSFLLAGDQEIHAIDPLNGELLWSLPISQTFVTAALDHQRIYTAGRTGRIQAYALPEAPGEEISTAEPVWEFDTQLRGRPELIPDTKGGLLYYAARTLVALDTRGKQMVLEADFQGILDTLMIGSELLLSTDTGIWSFSEGKLVEWEESPYGVLASDGEMVVILSSDGLYRADIESRSVEMRYSLTGVDPEKGDLVPVPGGGFLLAYHTAYDARLLFLDAKGEMVWERYYGEQLSARPHLVVVDQQLYLWTSVQNSAFISLDLYQVDMVTGGLSHLFIGGDIAYALDSAWIIPTSSGQVMIHMGGKEIFALDVELAAAVTRRVYGTP